MLTITPKKEGPPLPVGLWGCGDLGKQVAEQLIAGHGGNVRVVSVFARRRSPDLLATAASLGAEPCTSLETFLAPRPTVVLEVARAAALAKLGPSILEAGVDLIALSPSCLFDPMVEARFKQAVDASGRSMLIPSASAIGVDFLLANRTDQLRSVHLTVRWLPNDELPPYSGNGEPLEIFAGSARQAGRLYPRALNFVVATAMAGLGLDATEVQIQLDPRAPCTNYRLEIDAGATGLSAEVELRRPDGRRGRTAALSGVETLREIAEKWAG